MMTSVQSTNAVKDTTMKRTIRITLDVEISSLPPSEIDDIADIATAEDMTPEQAAECVLTETTEDEIKHCFDDLDLSELFAGSMLYLSATKVTPVTAEWKAT